MQQFIAKIEGGKLPRFVSEAVRSLFEKKGEGIIKITVEDYKPGRSNSQNAYYWAVLVGGIKGHLNSHGNSVTADHVHEFIKRKICPHLCEYRQEIILDGGEIETITAYSTKHLTTEQHSQMAEEVRAWAAGQGLQLLMPNESEPKVRTEELLEDELPY